MTENSSVRLEKQGKNIIILCDGTGQEGGVGNNTNVYKLYNMLLHRSPEQISYYDKGIGTGWAKVMTNVGGLGISKNILDCYRFLHEHYETGDNIYLLGFSRGAATVRSLSSFIHLFGVLPQSRTDLIAQAYRIYKIGSSEKRNRKAAEFIQRHNTMWCKIKFLGVWDTVAALGVPYRSVDVVLDKIPFLKHRFQDLNLSDSVQHAYQALSIDDERKTFHPELWAPVDGRVEQVWFCGVHTDVGGGYQEQNLSDISLTWMLEKAKAKGLKLYNQHKIVLAPDPDGHMHDSRGKKWEKLYTKKVRSWPHDTHGIPVLHESVTLRSKDSFNSSNKPYAPWILAGKYKVTK